MDASGRTITVATPGFVPAGTFVIGNSGDATLTGSGYTETGFKQDFWKATTTTGAPAGRLNHTAVWTGTKMIVWGGYDGTNAFNTGGQYDPVGNSWSATTTTGAPAARVFHTAVWTGTKMIVWGGTDGTNPFNTGGQYDPAGDSRSMTTTSGVPAARVAHTAVWTSSRMIVWGGNAAFGAPAVIKTGGQYGVLSLYLKN
jgi:hypothetical protein